MTTDKSMFAYFKEGTAHLPRTNRTVSFYGRELTLGEVMAEIDGFAARLTEIGVGKGDKTSDNYSVAKYEEQMLYMLKSQGQTPSKFEFTEIRLDVQVWPNGFLRKVVVTESYEMGLAGDLIDSVVTLTSEKAFFFDENDLPAADVDHGAFVVSQIGQVQAAAK